MSKNTYLGANVVTTDSFAGWIDKTNQVRDDMGRIVVTVTTAAGVEPNTINAGLTTGNLAIQGVVTANTIAVSSALRGGTVMIPGNLTISTNALFSSNVTISGTTSVGTIATGIWNGTAIAVNKGGTGQIAYTDGQLLIGSSTGSTLSKATLTAANNVAITNGAGSISIASNPSMSYTTSSTSGTVNITGSGTAATIPAANSTVAGLVTNSTQTLAGIKTFSDTTASTTKTTGAVVITGGLGVNGAINAGGDITAFQTSDIRLKTNIENIPDALSKLMQLNGVSYNWNDIANQVEHKDKNIKEIGVIAQEVNAILPEVVTTRENGYMAVRYEKLVPLLIEAIKELKAQLDLIKSKV